MLYRFLALHGMVTSRLLNGDLKSALANLNVITRLMMLKIVHDSGSLQIQNLPWKKTFTMLNIYIHGVMIALDEVGECNCFMNHNPHLQTCCCCPFCWYGLMMLL